LLVFVASFSSPAAAQSKAQLSACIQHAASFYGNRDGFMGLVAMQRNP
jgi:hypothetical protein